MTLKNPYGPVWTPGGERKRGRQSAGVKSTMLEPRKTCTVPPLG